MNCKTNKRSQLHVTALLILGLIMIVMPMDLLADKVTVEEKVIVKAPVKAVWAIVGGFQSLDRWHPAIVSSTLLGTGKEVGDIRVLHLNDNLTVVEKLEFYDDDAMSLQYKILEAPLPIDDYHATVVVKKTGNEMTEVVWKSSFKAVGASDEEAMKIISDIYLAGFEALNDLFK